MSISVEGQKCPVCQAYLFDDDDIVFCPECGAPHHRDCYRALGHCALEADHGTERQYDASAIRHTEEEAKPQPETEEQKQQGTEETYRCVRCGTQLGKEEQVCPNCRTPRTGARFVAFTPFGVHDSQPKSKWNGDTVVEDDITLKELVPIVSVNSARYADKFVLLNKKNKLSWNWAAFLMPAGWSFYRKSYRVGTLFLILLIAGSLLSVPFEQLATSLPQQGATYADLFGLIYNGGMLPTLLSLVGSVLSLAVRVIAALFGDYIYRGDCIEKAREIRKAQDEKETLYYKLGGVSPLWFMVAVLIEVYAPTLIGIFL